MTKVYQEGKAILITEKVVTVNLAGPPGSKCALEMTYRHTLAFLCTGRARECRNLVENFTRFKIASKSERRNWTTTEKL